MQLLVKPSIDEVRWVHGVNVVAINNCLYAVNHVY